MIQLALDRGVDVLPLEPAPQPAAEPALFLHTAWRSSGTWIWSRLRQDPGVMGFYEPLHEQHATLTPRRIARLSPGSWLSGHGGEIPYYDEFTDLLRRGGGVRGYHERFAADSYFLAEDDEDPELESYIDGLIAHARSQGRVPVLKFCRSLGRVGWMRRRFPDAMHAVVLRDPTAQWRSARTQLAATGNRYFLAGPTLLLARNARHPAVIESVERMGVRLPALPAVSTLNFDQEICWRHLAKASWDARYRCFLAFWTLSTIASLTASAQNPVLTIDADDLARSTPDQAKLEAAFAANLGLSVSLASDRPHKPDTTQAAEPVDPDAMARAHADAIGFLRTRRATLGEQAFSQIREKLAPSLEEANWDREPAHAPARTDQALAGWRQGAYFQLLRMSMPLRRLHGGAKQLLKDNVVF